MFELYEFGAIATAAQPTLNLYSWVGINCIYILHMRILYIYIYACLEYSPYLYYHMSAFPHVYLQLDVCAFISMSIYSYIYTKCTLIGYMPRYTNKNASMSTPRYTDCMSLFIYLYLYIH